MNEEYNLSVCLSTWVCLCLTISAHALCQALLQTAVLAAVAAGPVDLTITLPGAGVGYSRQLAAPEKTLRGGYRMVNRAQHKRDLRQIPILIFNTYITYNIHNSISADYVFVFFTQIHNIAS